MPSVNTFTHDQDPPHRPALTEVGGGGKLNNAKRPPDPGTMATAEDFNQISAQLVGLGKATPLAIIEVRIVAGVPSIFNVLAQGSSVVAASFGVTDNGVGDTSISWKTGTGAPAGALAPVTIAAVTQFDDVEIDRIRCFLTTVLSDPAVRVKTKLGASATDCNFVLRLY